MYEFLFAFQQPWGYLVSFARYSDLLVENRANFIPYLYLAPPQGVTPSEFREDLGVHKTRMNGLSCGEEIMTKRSAVLIPCQRVTDGLLNGNSFNDLERPVSQFSRSRYYSTSNNSQMVQDRAIVTMAD